MGNIVANNAHLSERASSLRTKMNTGKTLRLGRNNISTSPATVLADTQECNLAGYAGQAMTNDFAAPTSPTSGTYTIQGTTHTFVTTDVVGQLIYYWWIDDGTDILYTRNFPAGILLSLAGPLAILMTLAVKAEFLT